MITRAPKSDMIVAAAGPAMKLAQSITRRSLKSEAVMSVKLRLSVGAEASETGRAWKVARNRTSPSRV